MGRITKGISVPRTTKGCLGAEQRCSSHGAEDRVVPADGGAVLVVLGFGMANLVELGLKKIS